MRKSWSFGCVQLSSSSSLCLYNYSDNNDLIMMMIVNCKWWSKRVFCDIIVVDDTEMISFFFMQTLNIGLVVDSFHSTFKLYLFIWMIFTPNDHICVHLCTFGWLYSQIQFIKQHLIIRNHFLVEIPFNLQLTIKKIVKW